jgi:hypothetical protein
MTKTIECIDCGTPVAYGRLSCQACGALLASVGGRPSVAATSFEMPEPLRQPSLFPDDEVDQPTIWSSRPDDPVVAPRPTLSGRPYRLTEVGAPIAAAVGAIPGAYQPAGAGGASIATATVMAPPPAMAQGSAADERSDPLSADPTRLAEIAGWFVVVGATMAVLGFLLPWSSVVIGARTAGSWLDTWGLAGPGHLLVLGATLVVLALGIIHTAVPPWIRSGVAPLALGGLLAGLVWPYEVGPFGADVGAVVVGLGALAMVIGGVVTTWAGRHVEVDARV